MLVMANMLISTVLAPAVALTRGLVQDADASDFQLRVAFELCSNDVIDTVRNEYVRTIRPGVTRSARLNLTSAQHLRMQRLVADVRLTEYPDEFRPPLTMMREPGPVYRIELWLNGRHHAVKWTDYGSSSVEAQRLRTMLDQLRELVLAIPAVQRLPKSEILCL
jgi:hypothetical protein